MRLQAAAALSPSQRESLAALYQYLNPVPLHKEIEEALCELWKMAQPDPRSKAESAALAKIETSRKETKTPPRAPKPHHPFGNTVI